MTLECMLSPQRHQTSGLFADSVRLPTQCENNARFHYSWGIHQ